MEDNEMGDIEMAALREWFQVRLGQRVWFDGGWIVVEDNVLDLLVGCVIGLGMKFTDNE